MSWKQEVSSKPSFRKDVRVVKSELEELLESRQAREAGICQVRAGALPTLDHCDY